MTSMKINKRLKHISNYVDDFSNIIDVGCDHALLSIYLEKNKKGLSIIASDINEGPLSQAKKNVEKYGCKNIVLKLGNGISTIDDNTDTIIISGMGTNTIISILNDDKNKHKNIKKIIISPNNDFYLLRNTVTNMGYIIDKEEIICEKGKFYPIIVFVKGKEKYNEISLKYGINVLLNKDYYMYLEYLLKKYEEIEKDIPSNNVKKNIINEDISFIKNILNSKN